MPPPPPHLRALRLRSIVRIDVHGPEDRAKDASPGACDDLSCLRRVHAHRARMPTAFPSSASSGHPLSSARLELREDCPLSESDRPRPSFYRRPAKSTGVPKTGMPLTATTREGICSRRDCSLRPSRRLSRSRRPHFVPRLGTVFLMGIARSRCSHLRVRDRFESADTFITRRDFRAWD